MFNKKTEANSTEAKKNKEKAGNPSANVTEALNKRSLEIRRQIEDIMEEKRLREDIEFDE